MDHDLNRQNSVRGTCLFAEKVFQDQLILDRSVIGWQKLALQLARMEIETRDSKIAKGIIKIPPADFKRKILFLEGGSTTRIKA